MKLKLFAFFVAVLFVCNISHAIIRRVGFPGIPTSGIDYVTLQAAHEASSAGDTVYMYPGSLMNCTVSKKLIIFGPGYFLNPSDPNYPGNAGLQSFMNSTTSTGSFELQAGSNGSEIQGCNFDNIVYINGTSGDVFFKRCRFKGPTSYTAILFGAGSSQITFAQCVFEHRIIDGAGNIAVSNLSFLNCIFDFNNISSGYSEGFYFNSTSSSFSGLFQNCVFAGENFNQVLSNGSWLIQNCISQSNAFTGNSIIYVNDIGTGTQFPSGGGNQQNVAWNTIFNLTGSWDGKYTLKVGSPAIGAGTSGIDCGVFGGNAPYHLSGIPSIPSIYSLSSPQGTTPPGNTIQINVSTRSNN